MSVNYSIQKTKNYQKEFSEWCQGDMYRPLSKKSAAKKAVDSNLKNSLKCFILSECSFYAKKKMLTILVMM